MYKQQMNENITQGHARKLNKNKKAITISIKNYIQHYRVTNADKPNLKTHH